ncbi:MAG: zinc ribbon domain-containing protein [Chloroflexota bacterium]
MSAGKIIAYIAAAILIFFGVLFIWGSGGDGGGEVAWVVVGVIGVGIGFGLIWLASRAKSADSGQAAQNVTLQVDLPAGVTLDKFKCTNCGNPISKDDIKMIAGAPTVNCPYCGQVYQLTEEPKW